MKITEMLEREDFYVILKSTLEKYAHLLGISSEHIDIRKDKKGCCLYINPRLNAIMSGHPAKSVTNYLKTEYHVGGTMQKRIVVWAYLTMATSFVKSMSECGICMAYDNKLDELLIYPCNKKLRLFDFDRGIVHTILKDGFPDTYIERETKFRKANAGVFIPAIIESSKGYYSERIINGRPLARIDDTAFVDRCKIEAIQLIFSLTHEKKCINVNEYIASLAQRSLRILNDKPAFADKETVGLIFNALREKIDGQIQLVTSHGDLQPGNIWIENETDKLIIIDWETVGTRSIFYDYAALYLGMRRNKNTQDFYGRFVKHEFPTYMKMDCSAITLAKVVLAEELLYQTEELVSFPDTIGIKEYEQIINQYKQLKL